MQFARADKWKGGNEGESEDKGGDGDEIAVYSVQCDCFRLWTLMQRLSSDGIVVSLSLCLL